MMMSILLELIIILSVAYVTLYERKLLSIGQKRIGPNVLGYYGLLQPLLDGIKLILKESIIPHKSNIFYYVISPMLILLISLVLYLIIPLDINIRNYNNRYDLLYVIGLSSLTIYSVLYGGYFSNSKYSFISTLRATSQLISYELSLGLLILPLVIINESLLIYDIKYNQIVYNNLWLNILSFILLFICLLAETNRTPFDLLEAESELVSGYLTEYSSITFVLYYLAEYAIILFWSLFLDSLFNISYLINISLFIIIRGILPRFKYNQLIELSWYIILPISITIYFFNYLLFYII